jgi:hypothetical protein
MTTTTFKTRLQTLVNGVCNARGAASPTVWKAGSEGAWRCAVRGVAPAGAYTFDLPDTAEGEAIATLICTLARAQRCTAKWGTYYLGRRVCVVVKPADSVWTSAGPAKASDCLLRVEDLAYGALAGVEVKTNGDLQLFGLQGATAEGATTIRGLVGL